MKYSGDKNGRSEKNNTATKLQRLPDAELDIMLALWSAGEPLKPSAIMGRLEGKRDWSMSTLHVLLSRMLERGVVKALTEKNYRLYLPLLSENAYRQSETKSFVKKLYGNSAKRLIVALLEADALSDEETDEIARLLEAHRTKK